MTAAPVGISMSRPTAAMRSPRIRTFAVNGSAPVPSITVALVIAMASELRCGRASAAEIEAATSRVQASSNRFIGAPEGIMTNEMRTTLFSRPVSSDKFSVNQFCRQRSPVARIVRVPAIVAHHKTAFRIKLHRTESLVREIFRVKIRFVKYIAIHENSASLNPDLFTRQPDHALEVAFRRVLREVKDHDVAAIDSLVAGSDKNLVAVVESG